MLNNGEEMYKKSVLHMQSCFLLIKPIVVFSLFLLPSPLSITRFFNLSEHAKNIIESSAFNLALAKLIYYLLFTMSLVGLSPSETQVRRKRMKLTAPGSLTM